MISRYIKSLKFNATPKVGDLVLQSCWDDTKYNKPLGIIKSINEHHQLYNIYWFNNNSVGVHGPELTRFYRNQFLIA